MNAARDPLPPRSKGYPDFAATEAAGAFLILAEGYVTVSRFC